MAVAFVNVSISTPSGAGVKLQGLASPNSSTKRKLAAGLQSSIGIPTLAAIQTTEGAMGVNANHDNEGFIVVCGFDYQRYRPAILRTEPAVYPGFCERAIKVASSELRAVTTTEMG